MHSRSRVLIVGGHDPSGAGIDADLSALRDLDLDPLVFVTAWTDQDERGVRSVGPRYPGAWKAEAVAEALGGVRSGVAAIKVGLLPGADHVRAARDLLREARRHRDVPAVVDPVIGASSGGRFLDAEAVAALREELSSEGVILTPNLDEAAELSGRPIEELVESLDARVEAACALLAVGAAAVVVKGGHGREDPVCDLVVRPGGAFAWLARPRIRGGAIRGSGCRFASRLAAGLALGRTIEAAVDEAGRFVAAEIERRAGTSGVTPR